MDENVMYSKESFVKHCGMLYDTAIERGYNPTGFVGSILDVDKAECAAAFCGKLNVKDVEATCSAMAEQFRITALKAHGIDVPDEMARQIADILKRMSGR